MKEFVSKKTFWLSSFILVTSFAQNLYADSFKLTESKTEKINCKSTREEGETYTECYQNSTGKFSLSAVVSGDTFDQASISWDEIDESTPLELQIGDFNFSSTIEEATSKRITSSAMTGTWFNEHEVCPIDSDNCKTIKDTTIKINAVKNKNVKFTIIGNSKSDEMDEFGQRFFIDMCEAQGTGNITETATFFVNGTPISGDLDINCRVNEKTVTAKDGNDYTLVNVTLTAKLQP